MVSSRKLSSDEVDALIEGLQGDETSDGGTLDFADSDDSTG